MSEQGTRVIAFKSADPTKKEIYIYGTGTYVGDEPGGPMGEIPNPKIVLDSGQVVWGCECWWGEEEKIKTKYADWTFVTVGAKTQPTLH